MRSSFAMLLLAASALASCEGDVYRLDRGETPILPGDPLTPPTAYRDEENPLAGDPDAEAAGALLFHMRCAGCHGDGGRGDGPRAERLDPAPADLTALGADSDGYLLWRIEEGAEGLPFDSAMPAFGGSMSEDEAWQVIAFMRTLGASPDDGDPPDDTAPETPPSDEDDMMRAPPSEAPTR